MTDIRVMYISPDKIADKDFNPCYLSDEEFSKYAVIYDLKTFQVKFNYYEISELGYIRFIQVK